LLAVSQAELAGVHIPSAGASTKALDDILDAAPAAPAAPAALPAGRPYTANTHTTSAIDRARRLVSTRADQLPVGRALLGYIANHTSARPTSTPPSQSHAPTTAPAPAFRGPLLALLTIVEDYDDAERLSWERQWPQSTSSLRSDIETIMVDLEARGIRIEFHQEPSPYAPSSRITIATITTAPEPDTSVKLDPVDPRNKNLSALYVAARAYEFTKQRHRPAPSVSTSTTAE